MLESVHSSEVLLNRLTDLEMSIIRVCFILDQYGEDGAVQLALLDSYLGVRNFIDKINHVREFAPNGS